ncbi:bifunctional precorrin-2 dehydrogenase/sirohydrochlorin ferrochelatase [Elioraea sp.]|uniref:precorrin-2 dehydrogenase/sirohydrochlorin ferrochelatase family protein n=1 Tax=Elioraea sp. TaxID=2185103 RepID=UPI0025C3C633|nr:NAD(P)-dependent oxidoreductase [Elioraea sp.]
MRPPALLPLAFDLTAARVGIVGRDRQALNRLRLVEAAGVRDIAVWSDAPSPALADAATRWLRPSLPRPDEIAGVKLLFVCDLAEEEAAPLAATARRIGVLVNVEDVPKFCDVHVPAIVRRGDLTLTVSTRGAAPGLAVQIRRDLEARYGPEWDGRVAEIAALRADLRRQGLTPPRVAAAIAATVAARGWLGNAPAPPPQALAADGTVPAWPTICAW